VKILQNVLKFNVDDIDLIYEDDGQLAIAEILCCHAGNNLHNLEIPLETLKRAAPTLLNKFLVAGFDGRDFEGHEKDERIIGFFPKENDLKFVEKNGRTYLSARAIISKVYADWAYDVFSKEQMMKGDNSRSVSMEISVMKMGKNEQGKDFIEEFIFDGVTVLGKSITPACYETEIKITKFSVEEAEQFYKEFSQKDFSRYSEIDFTITPKIKKNCKEGLDLHKQLGGNVNTAKAMANFMAKNSHISPDRVRLIEKFFARHTDDDLDDQANFMVWQMYGGFAGRKWAKNIVEMMDSADEQKMSYFSDDITGNDDEENDSERKEETIYMEDEKEKVEETPEKKEEMAQEEMPDKEECAAPEQKEQEEEENKQEMSEDENEDDEGEEGEETPEEDEDDENKEECAFDIAKLSVFENEAEYSELKGIFSTEKVDYAKAFGVLFAMLSRIGVEKQQMATQISEFAIKESELENLRNFKKGVETEQFNFAVEATLNEVSEIMPKGEIELAREESKKFSLETIDIWKNAVKAKAFTFVKDIKKNDDGILRIGLPNSGNGNQENKDVWSRLKK
jgi:hypothetical protein